MTYDTRENRLSKYILVTTGRRLEMFKRRCLKAFSKIDGNSKTWKGDNKLIAEIDSMICGIQLRYTGNFLRNIEAELSESGMSKVFTMVLGYRDLFKYYLMLQRGPNVACGVFNLSVKDVAVFYEYWCFIKLSSMFWDIDQ